MVTRRTSQKPQNCQNWQVVVCPGQYSISCSISWVARDKKFPSRLQPFSAPSAFAILFSSSLSFARCLFHTLQWFATHTPASRLAWLDLSAFQHFNTFIMAFLVAVLRKCFCKCLESLSLSNLYLQLFLPKLIGASLSEPHTSVTALRMHVCIYKCCFAWTDHIPWTSNEHFQIFHNDWKSTPTCILYFS